MYVESDVIHMSFEDLLGCLSESTCPLKSISSLVKASLKGKPETMAEQVLHQALQKTYKLGDRDICSDPSQMKPSTNPHIFQVRS